MDLIKKTNFNFLGNRMRGYLFSFIVIAAGVVVFLGRGPMNNFGVDFIGGDILHITLGTSTDVADIRATLAGSGAGEVTVQSLGTAGREFIIKSKPDTSALLRAALEKAYGAQGFEVVGSSTVAPAMSGTLRKKSIRAFIFGVIGILLYLSFRFEFRFAVTAVVALIHDILFTAAVLAFFGRQIDASVIAGFLTIVGYSVNDKVVIFDRIRENLKNSRSSDYLALFNQSINDVLGRTLLTGVAVMAVLLCLFLMGGEPLHSLSLCLLSGFIVGTYSSIFVATALLLDWHRVSPHRFKL